jgi:regulator of RNase E activity RraA
MATMSRHTPNLAWEDDDSLFALMRAELFTAVVGDILDTMGLTHQFLPPIIKPLRDDMVVLGRAMPVLEADYPAPPPDAGHNPIARQPFGLMFEALDDLKRNEVYFATGASPRYALWGELMSTRARHLNAAGAVLDGYSRDTHAILRMGFPTFSYGRFAQDQGVRGKVLDYRLPLEAHGVRVVPGDLLFGDIDGVLVIPRAAENEAIRRAVEKVRTENRVRKAIEEGISTVEAFRRFGVM